jgi:hypothetical protein
MTKAWSRVISSTTMLLLFGYTIVCLLAATSAVIVVAFIPGVEVNIRARHTVKSTFSRRRRSHSRQPCDHRPQHHQHQQSSSFIPTKIESTKSIHTILYYKNQNVDRDVTATTSNMNGLSGVLVDITFQSNQHRPLGCIIEESLATSKSTTTTTTASSSTSTTAPPQVVFISSTTEPGAAAQAGLLVGDVIVGVSHPYTTTVTTTTTPTSTTTTPTASSANVMDVAGYTIERMYVRSSLSFSFSLFVLECWIVSLHRSNGFVLSLSLFRFPLRTHIHHVTTLVLIYFS